MVETPVFIDKTNYIFVDDNGNTLSEDKSLKDKISSQVEVEVFLALQKERGRVSS